MIACHRVVNASFSARGQLERLGKSLCTSSSYRKQDAHKDVYDAVIVGAGHNGLTCAAYLQQAGLSVCVLERRHIVGGAAVTEEIVPGFKFSRASYVLSLMRPKIMKDLELKRHGLKIHLRNPNSYTPLLSPIGGATSLTLGANKRDNYQQISQFSSRDAQAYSDYEHFLEKVVSGIEPLLDQHPLNVRTMSEGGLMDKAKEFKGLLTLMAAGRSLANDLPAAYELMTAPANKLLDKWFESEPLKATLATDSVIGAMTSPTLPGSGYVLLHHVMGELEGIKGAWGYVEGGMGALTAAIASSAEEKGVDISTNTTVSNINVNAQGQADGVVLNSGREIKAKVVLSNATPKVTFLDLLPQSVLSEETLSDVQAIDYTSPVTKINVAVNALPNFVADPNIRDNQPMRHHQTTIHLNCEHSHLIHHAYLDALSGKYSTRPVIEMTIPSVLDQTLAPAGCHVVQLFTQYTPYQLGDGRAWDTNTKAEYANVVFDCIEEYCPGFKSSVIEYDLLTPPDIEEIFGLTGGNIFHGAMSLDQLYLMRPTPSCTDHRTPIPGLYLCGSGCHPGGGVMGAAGANAAHIVRQDWKLFKK